MTVPAPSPRYVGPAKWHGAANNKPIARITIHATVGSEPGTDHSAENTVAFSKRTSTPSSYHYIVDAGGALQYVYDSVVAYHAPPNEHSIGIELCCSLSNSGKGHWGDKAHQDMLHHAAALVAQLCLHYGVPVKKLGPGALRAGKHGIAGHKDVSDAWHQSTHWDPGPYFPWHQFMSMVRKEVKDLKAPPEKKKPKHKKGPTRVSKARDALGTALALLKDAATKGKRHGQPLERGTADVNKALKDLPKR